MRGRASTKALPRYHNGVVRDDIFQILEDSVGVPEYYKWRSRSGCYFCFFQRQDEWLGLKRNHPELFKKARDIEISSGAGYTWVKDKTLDEVVAHAEEKEKKRNLIYPAMEKTSPRWQDSLRQSDDDDPEDQACLICSL